MAALGAGTPTPHCRTSKDKAGSAPAAPRALPGSMPMTCPSLSTAGWPAPTVHFTAAAARLASAPAVSLARGTVSPSRTSCTRSSTVATCCRRKPRRTSCHVPTWMTGTRASALACSSGLKSSKAVPASGTSCMAASAAFPRSLPAAAPAAAMVSTQAACRYQWYSMRMKKVGRRGASPPLYRTASAKSGRDTAVRPRGTWKRVMKCQADTSWSAAAAGRPGIHSVATAPGRPASCRVPSTSLASSSLTAAWKAGSDGSSANSASCWNHLKRGVSRASSESPACGVPAAEVTTRRPSALAAARMLDTRALRPISSTLRTPAKEVTVVRACTPTTASWVSAGSARSPAPASATAACAAARGSARVVARSRTARAASRAASCATPDALSKMDSWSTTKRPASHTTGGKLGTEMTACAKRPPLPPSPASVGCTHAPANAGTGGGAFTAAWVMSSSSSSSLPSAPLSSPAGADLGVSPTGVAGGATGPALPACSVELPAGTGAPAWGAGGPLVSSTSPASPVSPSVSGEGRGGGAPCSIHVCALARAMARRDVHRATVLKKSVELTRMRAASCAYAACTMATQVVNSSSPRRALGSYGAAGKLSQDSVARAYQALSVTAHSTGHMGVNSMCRARTFGMATGVRGPDSTAWCSASTAAAATSGSRQAFHCVRRARSGSKALHGSGFSHPRRWAVGGGDACPTSTCRTASTRSLGVGGGGGGTGATSLACSTWAGATTACCAGLDSSSISWLAGMPREVATATQMPGNTPPLEAAAACRCAAKCPCI